MKTTYKEIKNPNGTGIFKIGTITKEDLQRIATTEATKNIIEQIPNDYNIELNFENHLWFKAWKLPKGHTLQSFVNFIGGNGIPKYNDDYRIILDFVKSNNSLTN